MVKNYTISMRNRERITNIIVFIIVALVAIIMIVPLLFMISTSFKSIEQVFAIPPVWIPHPLVLGKYAEALTNGDFLHGFLNTGIIEVFVLLGGTFTSSLAAFAFSKMRFRHKEGIYLAILSTMMIPFPVIMLPQYVLFSKVGWVDTLLPLIVPALFGNVSMIFFLRQSLSGVPDSLVEAAKVDGCGYFRIYWQIIMPLIKPAIVTQLILWFNGIWNDYIAPSVYLTSPSKLTIQVVIAQFNSYYAIQTDYALIMAASVIALLPTMILFFIFQRFIIESMAISGIKE
ncbi:carbohydrate ABC transporter permease [Clostridium oryzae]|uniref:Lactose transport system permease protein LacG n=1 Tax=Clostridium oryzae TaxID=1450648 RepID=A0A1V4IHL5_9CLOT|nr:carbohydrate ABC transporter permease [Clostridium oryzae]OPJ59498.1 lactose transport system permease protein LacG [Clostridium oryzae]